VSHTHNGRSPPLLDLTRAIAGPQPGGTERVCGPVPLTPGIVLPLGKDHEGAPRLRRFGPAAEPQTGGAG
jgi:hypothetical protein